MGNPGNPGNYGQRFARLGSAKRQKTFLRPFTVRLPLFSAETMNASHFGLGLSGLVRNFFSAPFHKVTKSTLELDMRTRSQPWRVADFLRQDPCPGNVSHAFLLLEKSDICFVLYIRCAKNISMGKLTRHLVQGTDIFCQYSPNS